MTTNAVTSLLEAIPLPAVLIGPDARIRGANARAIAINPQAGADLGYILVFRQPGLAGAIEKCLGTREPENSVFLHNDGNSETRFNVTCAYVAGTDESADNSTDESTEGVLVCFSDVTPVTQAGRLRRDFVANVSHELRTPLTAILGFIETLQGPARNDETARDRFLDTMSNEASRMNRLVGDLLSLSRVEDEVRMRPTDKIDLTGVVQTVLRNLGAVADAAEVKVLFEVPDTPFDIIADRDQIVQVLTNLTENAIKYSGAECAVRLSLRHVARDRVLRVPVVAVTVADNGPGIEESHIPRLTERFYRIDSHRSRTKGGTGLGLAIVKHILKRHRGRLEIASTFGEGSEFTVFIPST